MRALCNIAYVAQVEHLDGDDIRDFDRKLVAEPGDDVAPVSRGTESLLAIMGKGKGPK